MATEEGGVVQVEKSHYEFKQYFDKRRWMSLYHQVDEVVSLSPRNVLEIGPGAGLFGTILGKYDVRVDAVDYDVQLRPDIVASATDLPLRDESYDCVCAFQMLEHLPYQDSMKVFDEMVRVAKRHLVISLPDVTGGWPLTVHVPKLGVKRVLVPKPGFMLKLPKIIDQHYWELGRPGYSAGEVLEDLGRRNVELLKEYKVHEYPYHHFFVFTKYRR